MVQHLETVIAELRKEGLGILLVDRDHQEKAAAADAFGIDVDLRIRLALKQLLEPLPDVFNRGGWMRLLAGDLRLNPNVGVSGQASADQRRPGSLQ